MSLRIERILNDQAATPSTKVAKIVIKLPEMNVPTFDGNILNWHNFWQRLDVAIHSKALLEDTEKLAYLRVSLKDGPARHVIESLTHDAECYQEAIN